MSNLSTKWTQHIKGAKEKEDYTKMVLSSLVLRRLKDILLDDLYNLEKPSEHDYDCASWSHKQAHRNGRVQQINALLTLLEPIK